MEDVLATAKKNQAVAQRETYRKERSIAKREKALADLVSFGCLKNAKVCETNSLRGALTDVALIPFQKSIQRR
jgi:hypothetical protein